MSDDKKHMAMRFRKCLDHHLAGAPISQRRFAFQAGLSQQKVYNMANHGRFNAEDLRLLYDLGIDMNWFVSGEGDPVRDEIRIRM